MWSPRRSFVLLAGLAAAIVPAVTVDAGGGRGSHGPWWHPSHDDVTFAVIGDIPYGATQVANFPYVVDQLNADPDLEFVSHVGDIKSGSSQCSDEYFDWVRSEFDRFEDALVYTPGDNEWTDCHRANNGAFDPYERLDAIRDTFFPVPNRTLGQDPLRVTSQQRWGVPENVRWRDGDVVFAALHVVGSNNGLAPWTGATEPNEQQKSEVWKRTWATLKLINETFVQARITGADHVVLIMQADMFDPTVADPQFENYSAFRPIVRAIAEQSRRLRGDVLLLDGDSHEFVEDSPLASGSSWTDFYRVRPVRNLTRITVEGAAAVDEYLKVTIDRDGVAYERVPLAPTPVTSVKVNEAESQGDTSDWVELVNLSAVDLDVSGFVVKDDDDTHTAVLPAGSIVPANGYLVVEEPVLDFGLGGSDLARFFAPDGTTLLDSTSWSGHAATTWGRCPDGTGSFQVTTSSTKGAANDCAALIGINEIESSGGDPGDWVELHNPGPSPSDISGWWFSDDDDTHVYTFPAGTVVAAGEYLVVDETVFGFGLGGGDSARLFRADGSLADSYTWTSHAATTYGRCPNWVGEFAETSEATKGAPNACGAPVETVKVNEVESSGGVPGDWVELVNTGVDAVDLSGWSFSDNDDTHVYAIPVGTTIAAGGLIVLDEADFGFGIGSGDSARLFRPDGTLADSYTWTSHAVSTYGRCPDGTGEFVDTTTATKGAANDCGPAVVESVKVNEVESNGDTTDWVELVNVGPSDVDLSRWTVVDNDPTHTPYAFPAGTVIAAGGYLTVDDPALGFGLGGGDSVTLARPDGSVADSYGWSAHAATTYGRCPDGVGEFAETAASTKGAANDCPTPDLVLNEVESNGGFPDDWVELLNLGTDPIDLSAWTVLDNDDTHVPYTVPAGTVIAPGEFLVLEGYGWGLGSADSVRISDASGALVITWSWTAHATTTYGRCPDGTGDFTTTLESTKGAPNACGSPVVINEVESNGDTNDWVELYNPTAVDTDVSGYVVRDNDDANGYVFPAGSVVPALGYLVVDSDQTGFGLGGADSARLFDAAGVLVDSYDWAAHATTTYGRCPDGTGAFEETVTGTRGGQNRCVGIPYYGPWPGGGDVVVADAVGTFAGNMSGLAYEPSGTAAAGVLWASQNGPGALYRLLWNGATWEPDTADGWGAGKLLRYPDGTGDVDAEGVTVLDASSVYVGSERNNGDSGVSRNSVLLFDPAAAGSATSLTASMEWNVTAQLPVTGANTGIEAVAFVPDSFLVANGFVDQTTGAAYDPSMYPDHGDGLFFVGVEATGGVYAFELDHADGTATLLATIASGFPGLMALEFDAEIGQLWVLCDDGCQGRSSILEVNASGAFEVVESSDRPASMPNLNNEGFAITPLAECAGGVRPAFWADDSDTAGNSLRQGTLTCP